MVCEDLQTSPHDKQHEKHVQEVLKLQPPREPRINRRRGLRNAGMLPDECLYAGKFAQALSQGDQAEQRRGGNRQAPQRVDPAPSNADPGRDPALWRHPVAEADAIVGIAQFCTEWFDRERF